MDFLWTFDKNQRESTRVKKIEYCNKNKKLIINGSTVKKGFKNSDHC